jgi:riboflavin kinase/FMN adenylyltransferase
VHFGNNTIGRFFVKVYRNIEDFKPAANTIATIGTFDGVHTGHHVIISRVKKLSLEMGGESVIITFSPHPQLVLHPEEKNIFILTTDEEKIKLLERQGIDHLIIIDFTKEFSTISYLNFIKDILIDKLHVKKLVIGYDHHFGNHREGQLKHLVDYGKQYNFEVEDIPAQKVEDITVSSTKIRKALAAGDISSANKFLGYNYFFSGRVIKGDGIGKTLGFPTANLEINNPYKLIPAQGVYAVKVEYKGENYGGMMDIGTRPTFNGNKQVIEINIFNFDKYIYSEFLYVSIVERLRSDIKFHGVEELKEQLLKDKLNAEKILNND